jgi:hypothetical protein
MLLVLFAASGGHWMMLQSVAWTRMLVAYSHDGQLVEALAKTFDGKHPCALCKTIQRAKDSEPQPARAMEVDGPPVFVEPVLVKMVRNEGVSWKLEIPQWAGQIRAEPPAAPPPRSATA